MLSRFVFSFVVLLASATQALEAKSYLGSKEWANKTYDHLNIIGSTKLTNVAVTNLSITGPLVFRDLTVQEKAHCTGNVSNKKGFGKFNKLSVVGSTSLNNIKCKEKLSLTGTTVLTDATIEGDASMVGSTTLKHTNICGTTTITGPCRAFYSSFTSLDVTAPKVMLTSCTANTVTIKKNTSTNYHHSSLTSWITSWFPQRVPEEQTLVLDGETTINGSITFESGKGILIVNGDKVNIIGDVVGCVKRQ